MRIYGAAVLADVEVLAAGESLVLQAFIPVSEEEDDEFAAFEEAAGAGDLVIAADVDSADELVGLDKVASFHLDIDDSGDLAWFATQEIDEVLLVLRSTSP